jgi:hypothetical protein
MRSGVRIPLGPLSASYSNSGESREVRRRIRLTGKPRRLHKGAGIGAPSLQRRDARGRLHGCSENVLPAFEVALSRLAPVRSAILALLAHYATFSMPPNASCCRGRTAIGDAWVMGRGPPRAAYVATEAHGHPDGSSVENPTCATRSSIGANMARNRGGSSCESGSSRCT